MKHKKQVSFVEQDDAHSDSEQIDEPPLANWPVIDSLQYEADNLALMKEKSNLSINKKKPPVKQAKKKFHNDHSDSEAE